MASDFRCLLLSPKNAPFDEFIFSIKFCEIFQGFIKKIPGLLEGFQGFPGLQKFVRVFQDFQGPYEPCLFLLVFTTVVEYGTQREQMQEDTWSLLGLVPFVGEEVTVHNTSIHVSLLLLTSVWVLSNSRTKR